MDKQCLICFKKIENFSLRILFEKDICCCDDCLKEMEFKLKKVVICDIEGISIYPYNDFLRKLIYQYKGCKDFELRKVFLKQYKWIFKIFFKGRTFVPIPSYKESDIKRGFNHVEEILKTMDLKYVKCIEKTKDVKQASLNQKERKNIGQYLSLNDKSVLLENERVVLFDDVLTTGSTMTACIKLIKTLKIRDISFVVIASVGR